MPFYTYDCESCQSSTDIICQYKDRPEETACAECDGVALRRSICWNPPPEPVSVHPVYGRPSGASLSEKERAYIYLCESKHVTVEFYASPPAEMQCEDCDLVAKKEVGCNLDMHWAKYPYYDRGLGCIVKSERHRREVAKSKGLTPVDGDFDTDPHFRKEDSTRESEQAAYREYYDAVQNDPAYRDYWKARDEGREPDMLPPD
jgi:hypothetical protein